MNAFEWVAEKLHGQDKPELPENILEDNQEERWFSDIVEDMVDKQQIMNNYRGRIEEIRKQRRSFMSTK